MSAFTALNGTSPKADSHHHQHQQQQGDKPPTPEDRRSIPATSPRQGAPENPPATQRESWPTQGPGRHDTHQSNMNDQDASHKRKRSGSANSHHTPEMGAAATNGDSQGKFETPQREYRRYGDVQQDKEGWYPHQGRDDRHPHDSHHNSGSPNDDQGSDSQRRAQGDHSDYGNTSPDAEDRSGHHFNGNGTGEQRNESLIQHDPKKRKRNFSNRTKTGCLTCRRRKKKCDEQKPECINCIRGGFVCAGYPPQRGAHWPKLDNKAPAVPLESKDPSYVPPGAYGMPQPGQYGPQPVKREPLPQYRGQALRIDPPAGRPLMAEDDRPTATTLPSASVASPPDNKLSSLRYPPPNAFPTPVSANPQPPPFGDRMGKDYQHQQHQQHQQHPQHQQHQQHPQHQHVPPLHDLARPEQHEAHHGTQLPQINLLHHGRVTSPPNHVHPPGPGANTQQTAQMALAQSQFQPRRTQKEEMLTGRHFYPFDKELCLERERCTTACWKFNNLTAPPTHGVSPEERARLFLDILQPREPVRISPSEASPMTNVGRVGRHVAVETPFNCDYGYNISIGHHVVVGRNCTINDISEVKIGDNCVIGPNVSIYTAHLPLDPKKRQGGQGPQFGRPVIIEQDCFIGGGATILPGRTIGKGSTVGAGSIVTKDVPPFTVVAGNPARVLRGISS